MSTRRIAARRVGTSLIGGLATVLGVGLLQPTYANVLPEEDATPELVEFSTSDVEPGVVDELTTATSTTTLTEDGTYVLEAFSGPVNYLDADGEWQEIDTSLVGTSGDTFAARSAANEFVAKIPADGSEAPLRMQAGDAWVAMQMFGLDDAPDVQGSVATFDEVEDAAKVVYEVTGEGVKEDIVLNRAPNEPLEYRYTLTASPGLEADVTDAGAVEFRDVTGDLAFAIPPGTMSDAAAEPAISSEVSYSLTGGGGHWTMTVIPDFDWLSAPARVYPVAVDPTLVRNWNPTPDCTLRSAVPTTPACGNGTTRVKVGRSDASTRYRGLLDFDISSVPTNATVTDASVKMYLDQATSNTIAYYQLHRPGYSFNSGATWNNNGLGTGWDGGDPSPSMVSTNWVLTNGGAAGWKTWDDLDDLFQGYVTAPSSWRGFVVKQQPENVNNVLEFYSSSSNSANNGKRPTLHLEYTTPPSLPSALAISNCVSSCTSGTPVISALTPTLSAKATDHDGDNLTYTFRVRNKPSPKGQVAISDPAVERAEDVTASWPVTAGALVRGREYEAQVTVTDGTTSQSGLWYPFAVQALAPTPAPTEAWTMSPCNEPCSATLPATASKTPQFSARWVDTDTNLLRYTFSVRDPASPSTVIDSAVFNNQVQGQRVYWTVAAGKLQRGKQYEVNVAVWDGESTEVIRPWTPFETTPAYPFADPAGSWTMTPCETSPCGGAVPITASKTPKFSARYTDDEPDVLRYTFTVRDAVTKSQVATQVYNAQTRGQWVEWTVPANLLARGKQYEAEVKVWDGVTTEVVRSWYRFAVKAESPIASTAAPWSMSPCTEPCTAAIPVTGSKTPKFVTRWSDTDTDLLRYTFTVRDDVTDETVANTVLNGQPQDQPVSWTVPTGVLARGNQYEAQVAVWDGESTEVVRPWYQFQIDATPPAPTRPTVWSMTPCVAPCTDEVPMTNSVVPTLSVTSTDIDSASLQYTYTVTDFASEELVATGVVNQQQGQPAPWQVPATALVPGTQYTVQVVVYDGEGAPVEGESFRFGVATNDDIDDPTVAVPEDALGAAAEVAGLAPNGDSDKIWDLDEVTTETPTASTIDEDTETPIDVEMEDPNGGADTYRAASTTDSTRLATSWRAAAGMPVKVRRIGDEDALAAGVVNNSDGSVTNTADVGLTWTPIVAQETGAVPTSYEIELGRGEFGEVTPTNSEAEADEANTITETATQNGLEVRVDYDQIADDIGGNWSDRLTIMMYPACYRTHPEEEVCAQGVEVPTVNDPDSETLTFVAPPVAATEAPLTATVAGATQFGGMDKCTGKTTNPLAPSNPDPAPVVADDPSTPVFDDPETDTDGVVDLALEDVETATEPVYPEVPDDTDPVVLPDTEDADMDLDANNDNIEDVEPAPGPEPSFVDPDAPTLQPLTYRQNQTIAQGCASAVMALKAPAGDFAQPPTASTVNPAGSWQVGEGSGEFSWTYPFAMPPGIGSEMPSLALSYSSGAVDGMTTVKGGQGSAAGLGWTMEPGFISRSYRACADDGHKYKGDLCWASRGNGSLINELELSLAGQSTSLVQYATGQWRLEDDPGWRVIATDADGDAPAPGEETGFVITSTDGTQYKFGLRGGAESMWRVPVYGNDENEPCFKPNNQAGSYCQTPWRWNLETILDTDGNRIQYTYKTERNHYERWGSHRTLYDAAGRLTKIEYGYASAGEPTVRVEVASTDRCIQALSSANANCTKPSKSSTNWPDVPVDLICYAAGSCTNISASFFSRKRYATITTRILDDTNGGKGTFVDQYRLVHSTPDPDRAKGGDEPNLWLARIEHVGKSNNAESAPLITVFRGIDKPNRVRGAQGDRQLRKYRVGLVVNETGGRVLVTYGHATGRGCTGANVANRNEWAQGLECFARKWKPEWAEAPTDPYWDWFHKYVVTKVLVGDDTLRIKGDDKGDGSPNLQAATNTPGSLQRYDYVYHGAPAWRFDDSENTVYSDRGWNDWRGYATTEIRTRSINDNNVVVDGSESIRLVTRYRGMSGTRMNRSNDGGKHEITINPLAATDNPDDVEVVTDKPSLAGRTIAEALYEGGAKANWISRTYHGYQTFQTATGQGDEARMVLNNLTRTYTRVWDDAKPRVNNTWRTYARGGANNRGVLMGALIFVKQDGKVNNPQSQPDSVTGPTCATTTWVSNETKWIRAPQIAATSDGPTCGHLLSRNQRFYDGASTSNSGKIDEGKVTSVVTEVGKSYSEPVRRTTTTRVEYGPYGRVKKTIDPLGRATTIEYNAWGDAPSNNAFNPVNKRVYSIETTAPGTNPIFVQLEPRRGLPVKEVNENGNYRTSEYDLLGRVTSFTAPSHNAEEGSPKTITFEYQINKERPSKVTTRTRRGDETIAYLDGWGRSIETQRAGPLGGRLVSTTYYNEQGLPYVAIPEVYAKGRPGTGLLNPTRGSVPRYTETSYDAAGRAVKVEQYKANRSLYSTSLTSYKGDRIIADPPRRTGDNSSNGQVVSFLDLQGNTWRSEQYANNGVEHAANYEHDGAGRLLEITSTIGGSPRTWTYTYDLAGRRLTAADPDTGLTSYVYNDDQANIDPHTTVTSPTGPLGTTGSAGKVELRTDYDNRGRPTMVRQILANGSFSSPLTTWTYDTAMNGQGLPATETTTNGTGAGAIGTVTRTIDHYDEDGNPTHVIYSAGPNGRYKAAETYQYTDGRLTNVAYAAVKDPSGNVILPATSVRSVYATNAALQRIVATDSEAREWYLANFEHYKTGEVKGIESAKKAHLSDESSFGNDKRLARTYRWDDPLGRMSSVTANGYGTLQYAYDERSNPVRITARSGSITAAVATRWCYTYDGIDRLREAKTGTGADCESNSVDTEVLGGGREQDLKYHYAKDRLTSINSTSGTTTRTATYDYDATSPLSGAGTSPHQTSDIQASGDDSYLPPATELTYDNAGRVTIQAQDDAVTTYAYNPTGTLATTSYPCPAEDPDTQGTLTFGYDGSGIRALRRSTGCGNDSTTAYLGQTEIVERGSSFTARRTYATPNGTPLAIQAKTETPSEVGDDTWTWVFGDSQDSTRLQRDQSDGERRVFSYLPFGDPTTSERPSISGDDRGYLNKVHDPNGEIRLDHRSYSSSLNLLTTPDPILVTGDPQSLNPYSYSRNNPISFVDPTGLNQADSGGGGEDDEQPPPVPEAEEESPYPLGYPSCGRYCPPTATSCDDCMGVQEGSVSLLGGVASFLVDHNPVTTPVTAASTIFGTPSVSDLTTRRLTEELGGGTENTAFTIGNVVIPMIATMILTGGTSGAASAGARPAAGGLRTVAGLALSRAKNILGFGAGDDAANAAANYLRSEQAGAAVFGNRTFGASSRLFGNSSMRTSGSPGILNNKNLPVRMGWSVRVQKGLGTNKTKAARWTFRINFFGKEADLFRGPYLLGGL